MANILVIDEKVLVRSVVAVFLSDLGHWVSAASTGREGLTLARTQQPNLILADVCVPDMHDLELIHTLRERFPAVPVVAMAGGPRPERDLLSPPGKVAGRRGSPSPSHSPGAS